ncbi:MAG: Na/Pi symporter [Coleofasciculaceae cyanobacterium RL_1_1]|nr:Na/Pi symporter [Coleofasciculaceae cyanobacterium RL_1_1]
MAYRDPDPHTSVDVSSTSVDRSLIHQFWWVGTLAAIVVLSFGLTLLSVGLSELVGDRVEQLFQFATNPALGLLVGVITTALVQSSSAVTSIVVGLVATGMPVTTAIPIIMGANIGTTITNTLLSLGQIGDRDRFERSFAAATVHDCFNLIGVAIFLPLEISTHFLTRLSGLFADRVQDWGLVFDHSIGLKLLTAPLVKTTVILTQHLPPILHGSVWLGLGIITVLLSIAALAQTLTLAIQQVGQGRLFSAIGAHPLLAMLTGTGITVIVQSSSTTTSLMIPLAASRAWELETIYPFTLGANIGTCATAFLAATAVTGSTSIAALQIALAHLLHNTLGILTIYGIPALRSLPLRGARWLARSANNPWAIASYILGIFFLIPGLAIAASLL